MTYQVSQSTANIWVGDLFWNQFQMEANVPQSYVCLSMLVGNLVNWWKIAWNSRFICGMQQTKSSKLYIFTCIRQAWGFSGQSTSNSSMIYQCFPSRNLCDLALLICLLEFGFGFENSLWRGQVFGKLSLFRSLDRSASCRVKDSKIWGRDQCIFSLMKFNYSALWCFCSGTACVMRLMTEPSLFPTGLFARSHSFIC